MTRPNQRYLLLLLPLLLGTALAQEQELPGVEEEEIRRYTVEMIIFTYNEDVSVGSEVFVPDPPPPEEDELSEIELMVHRKYELVMLAEEDFTLNEVYGHLERLDVYEPVLHFGWTQPTLPEEDSAVRPLSSFVTPPAGLGLEGDLQLYLGRYLHLVIDLQLDAPSSEEATTVYEFGDYTYTEQEGGRFDEYAMVVEQPVHYRIQENRIFRSGEIRYFDHPKFGVLAKITRWEEPDPEELNEAFLGDAELLGLDGQ